KVTARNVGEKGAERRRGRRRYRLPAEAFGSRHASGDEANGGALDVALDTRNLPGKAQAGVRLEAQRAVQQLRAVEERVAMQAAEPCELGVLQPRDHAENSRLLAVLQLRLEPDHVPQRAEGIVLPKLHDGMG